MASEHPLSKERRAELRARADCDLVITHPGTLMHRRAETTLALLAREAELEEAKKKAAEQGRLACEMFDALKEAQREQRAAEARAAELETQLAASYTHARNLEVERDGARGELAAVPHRGIYELRQANRGLIRQLDEARRENYLLSAALKDEPESCNTGPDVKAQLRKQLDEMGEEYEELEEECAAWKVRAEEAEARSAGAAKKEEP